MADSQNLLIGVQGVGNDLFSAGIREGVERLSNRNGWEGFSYRHTSGSYIEERLAKHQAGRIIGVAHSMGVDTIDRIAEESGLQIDVLFAVASAFPERFPDNVKKVYWISATGDFRKVFKGEGNQLQSIEIEASHTSVDDSERLWQLVESEMKMNVVASVPIEVKELHQELAIILDPETETRARTAFYKEFTDRVRQPVFSGRIDPDALDGLKRLLWLWDKFFSHHPTAWLAFILQQIGREVGLRYYPIREANGTSDADTIRRLDNAWAAGRLPTVSRPYWRTGEFGRGEIQVTHESNRGKLDRAFMKVLGWNPGFSENRDLLLDPVLSGLAAMIGCIEGTFRGHKLADYNFPKDFGKARDIVNGDTATSGDVRHANAFLVALESAQEAAEAIGEDPQPLPPILPPVSLPTNLESMVTAQVQAIRTQHPTLNLEDAKTLFVRDIFKLLGGVGIQQPEIQTLNQQTERKVSIMNENKSPLASSGIYGPLIAIVSAAIMLFTGVELTADTQQQLVQIFTILMGGTATAALIGRHNAKERIEGVGKLVKDFGGGGSILTVLLSLAAAYQGIDLNGTVGDQLPTILPTGGGLVGGIIGILGNLYRSKRIGKK